MNPRPSRFRSKRREDFLTDPVGSYVDYAVKPYVAETFGVFDGGYKFFNCQGLICAIGTTNEMHQEGPPFLCRGRAIGSLRCCRAGSMGDG